MEVALLILLLIVILLYTFRRIILRWAMMRFIKRMTGGMDTDEFSDTTSTRQRPSRSSSRAQKSSNGNEHKNQIFTDNEGSYIDFEEV